MRLVIPASLFSLCDSTVSFLINMQNPASLYYWLCANPCLPCSTVYNKQVELLMRWWCVFNREASPPNPFFSCLGVSHFFSPSLPHVQCMGLCRAWCTTAWWWSHWLTGVSMGIHLPGQRAPWLSRDASEIKAKEGWRNNSSVWLKCCHGDRGIAEWKVDPSQHEEVWRSSQRLELLTVFLSRILSSPPYLFLPVFLLFLLQSHRACLLSPIMSGALMMGLRWFSHSLEGVGLPSGIETNTECSSICCEDSIWLDPHNGPCAITAGPLH